MELNNHWINIPLEDLTVHVIGGDWGKESDFIEDGYEAVACIRGSEFKHWKIDFGRTAVIRKIKISSIKTRELLKGDILVEISGGGPEQPVGRTVLISDTVLKQHNLPIVCTNFIRMMRLAPCINSVFVNRYLELFYLSGEVIKYQGGSNNLRNLKFKDYSKINIPLPSYAEQKIIADKLDDLLARVESIKTRLENIPEILKKFRQSVLSAAVSGKLTEEWREKYKPSESAKELLARWISFREEKFSIFQKELLAKSGLKRAKKFTIPLPPDTETAGGLDVPTSWEVVSVSQIADCLDSQRIPVKKENRTNSEGIYPYFGANGEVDRVDTFIFDGDYVLVTEDETFYGRVKPIAYRYTGKCWVNNHAHILSAPTKSANDYLCYALMHYKVIPWLTGTTGRAKLTQAALNVLPIGLPPECEIEEIVFRIENFFTYANSVQHMGEKSLSQINNLTQSILVKAFRGELTAQWREENPELISGLNSAEALLEKITAEKLAAGTLKKRAKKTSH